MLVIQPTFVVHLKSSNHCLSLFQCFCCCCIYYRHIFIYLFWMGFLNKLNVKIGFPGENAGNHRFNWHKVLFSFSCCFILTAISAVLNAFVSQFLIINVSKILKVSYLFVWQCDSAICQSYLLIICITSQPCESNNPALEMKRFSF